MRGTLTRDVEVVIGRHEPVNVVDTGDGYVTLTHQVTTRIPREWFVAKVHMLGGIQVHIGRRYTLVVRVDRYGRDTGKTQRLVGYEAHEQYGTGVVFRKEKLGQNKYVTERNLVSIEPADG